MRTETAEATPPLGIGFGDNSHGGSASAVPELGLKVKCALLVNSIGGGLFVTAHDCHTSGEGVSIGIGRPVPRHEITNILSPVLGASMEWLPPNLLAQSPDEICWWIPPSRRSLWFRVGRKTMRYQVPLPGLVLCAARRGALRIFATKGDRPGRDAQLYHAPLMNIDSNGFMCFGNIPAPQYGLAHISSWESVLFDTCFVHVNHQGTLLRPDPVSTEDLLTFWRKLKGRRTFRKKWRPSPDQRPGDCPP